MLQIGAICVLFLAAGGISWRELGSDMLQAFEVIRRGEEEKEIIVPLTGTMPRPKEPQEPPPPPRVTLDEPPKQSSESSIPLD